MRQDCNNTRKRWYYSFYKCTERNSTFTFKKEQISTAIKRLESKKVSKSNDIPFRTIKEFSDIFEGSLAKNYNECWEKGFFPDEVKCAEVVPVYKNDKKDKNNNRPVSILSNMSKLYERCMHQQINEYLSLLSQVSMRFETKIQWATLLLVIVEKMKKSRDNNGVFSAVLTDLFKAFDCIPHGLLKAKLNAFGFD